MDSHFKPQEWVGAKTLNAAKKTRLWALSAALDRVLYDMHDQQGLISDGRIIDNGPKHIYSRVERRLYMGIHDEWAAHRFPWILDAVGTSKTCYADVPQMLRHIQLELERLAVLEVTS